MLLGYNYGPAVDWWALGIVMYIMMVGQHPFQSPTRRTYGEKILHKRVVYPRKLTPNAVSILKGVSIFNPRKRKHRPLYLKTQSVPRCKHFLSRL
jgi:serine/threonine protein kinase